MRPRECTRAFSVIGLVTIFGSTPHFQGRGIRRSYRYQNDANLSGFEDRKNAEKYDISAFIIDDTLKLKISKFDLENENLIYIYFTISEIV
jgi:hypothetical protein